MARARNIKPALFKNELLGVADPLLTLLFQSLWTLADKEGRLEDRPLRIKAETFPYRDGLDVNGYLTELQRLGFIVRYLVGDLALIQVVNFKKHQTPHNTEKPSTLPPVEAGTIAGCAFQGASVKSPLSNSENVDALPPDSLVLIPDSLVLIPDTSAPAKPAMFDTFWSLWPATDRRTQRAKCKANWTKNNLDAKADEILEHVAALKKTEKWMSGFEPAPMTYLNGSQWEDGVPEIDRSTQQPKPQFLTAQQQRDENNRRSTAEFLADDTPVFGHQPIEGECSNA